MTEPSKPKQPRLLKEEFQAAVEAKFGHEPDSQEAFQKSLAEAVTDLFVTRLHACRMTRLFRPRHSA